MAPGAHGRAGPRWAGLGLPPGKGRRGVPLWDSRLGEVEAGQGAWG